MPPIGLLLGNVDFANLFISLSRVHYDTLKAAKDAGAPTINYGVFIATVIDFLVVAFVIFVVIKKINRFKRKPAELAPSTKECAFCASAIPIKAIKCPQCTSDLLTA
jgi:large conductance mechanosensitive channel